jgi:hypothetical protein
MADHRTALDHFNEVNQDALDWSHATDQFDYDAASIRRGFNNWQSLLDSAKLARADQARSRDDATKCTAVRALPSREM